jgi:hypothetical protein
MKSGSTVLAGLLVALALLGVAFLGSVNLVDATTACPPNPKPPDAADPSMIVDTPSAGATVTSPVTISGKARVFEANVRITILDAGGNLLADTFTTAAEGAPTLAPYSTSVNFAVSTAQQGCIRVFEESAMDGSPRNVVQLEVNLAPQTTPPSTGSAGLQEEEANGSHFWFYVLGAVALVGSAGLALKRSFWE